ncbi:MAG: histidine phosphatase family protein [Myxococcota bacterium]|nr:histidine phosphatase family protein [Myxococcota bacterium]
MKVHLVRHAKAEKRSEWDGPDLLRPLTSQGTAQSRGIAEQLLGEKVERLVSSPHLRCRQTLRPLSEATGLPVEIHESLAKGESPAKAIDGLRSLGASRVVCCTHSELLDRLESELIEAGIQVGRTLRELGDSLDPGTRRLAVLDMGSTSFHLMVADVASSGSIRMVDRVRDQLRLGAVLAEHGHIPEPVCERAVAAAKATRKRVAALGAEQILPVATAALREADNGSELADRLASALGAPVRLLSGEEEARIIFGAFRRRILLPRKSTTLGLDLGGGSLELVLGSEKGVEWETTLPLGVARLQRSLVKSDPMKKKEGRRIASRVREELLPVRKRLRDARPGLCVAAGGTARALGFLAVGLRGLRPIRSVNELHLSIEELAHIGDRLRRASHDERLGLPGMKAKRADLLPTGALIIEILLEELGLDGLTITDWGLREGILLEALETPRAS